MSTRWKEAMLEEYQALMKIQIRTSVNPKPGAKVIENKWVFKIKKKPDRSIARYKARLIAKKISSSGRSRV